MKSWFDNSYRRCLVDMHIEDWNDEFMSRFDAEEYVRLMEKAHVQSAMVYANSHVGHCYWPTKTGHMHSGLKGRDIFGELLGLCRRKGIDFIAYYSLIFNNWAYDHDPSWRIVDASGKSSRDMKTQEQYSGRYGVCCPNTGYRDFVVAQIEELCENYDFDGMFFDMTFWPMPCYCNSCRKRFKKETGHEIPIFVDWNDPLWLEFQNKREEWMAEFAALATGTVKRFKQKCTVLHNITPPTIFNWYHACTNGVLRASDYLGGDVYGDFLEQSFVCKFYYNMSRNLPFEYYTSRCDPNLEADHTAMKRRERLMLNNYLTLAHRGAFLFIDAIDPIGTLNEEVYDVMGEIFNESKKYESHIGGEMVTDVAVYYSLNSKMNIYERGKIAEVSKDHRTPHVRALLGASRILKENHVPFTVIGEDNFNSLSKYQILILPDVVRLTSEEALAVKEFVKNGGSLYASGSSGKQYLAELFGIEYIGKTAEKVTFMAPTQTGTGLMPGVNKGYPLTINGHQLLVKVKDTADVLATMMLPYTDPEDYKLFASIHSNPPGKETAHPSIIYREYGKGKVIWAAAAIEAINREPHEKVFINIIKRLKTQNFAFESDAPPVVEFTIFHQTDRKRYVINVINEQEKLPPVKVQDIKVKVRTDGRKIRNVVRLPENIPLNYEIKDEYVEVIVPELYLFDMIAINYE